ncbi:Sec-independent protein translocase subunit TatA [Streptomyces sp. NPDC059373]
MLRNGLEPWHLLVVVLVVILLFGSKKLPEAARGLGKSLRILKSETRAMKDDDATAARTADSAEAAPGPAAGEQPAPQTIQSAPGDVTAARLVKETRSTAG